jgi:hypothetical protein
MAESSRAGSRLDDRAADRSYAVRGEHPTRDGVLCDRLPRWRQQREQQDASGGQAACSDHG